MPFKSEAQRRYLYKFHPKMAKKWEKHTPKGKKLPERVKSTSESVIGNKLDRILKLDLLEDTIVNIPISFKHKIDEAMGK